MVSTVALTYNFLVTNELSSISFLLPLQLQILLHQQLFVFIGTYCLLNLPQAGQPTPLFREGRDQKTDTGS